MSDGSKASIRIDWFDGTLMEDIQPNAGAGSEFADEDQPEPQTSKSQYSEKKPIGFKRLLDLSLLKPPILTLEVSHRPGFWNLLDVDLKGDFIVLIVRILVNVYKSTEPREKSKIATMLRTRFRNSNFIYKLRKYLMELPYVKIVDKRMNSYLWDDVEIFYFQVLELCISIVHFGSNTKEYNQNLYELLEELKNSAIGVHEEHMETFREDLFLKIDLLKTEILSQIKDNEPSKYDHYKSESKAYDVEHFKNLDIFPSKQDLLEESMFKIKPNIINGAYQSVEQYLDLQFKLLREDCFGPLRDGLCKYMENPSKRRHENIRVYSKARIIHTYVSNNKVGHLVDIAWNERVKNSSVDRTKYAYNKHLIFGSLLLFTSDNFETILCATVLDSRLNLLSDGYVAVLFQNPVSKKIFAEPYLMVESEVFFEPYHQVLKVLQNSSLDDLPMRKYIVDVQPHTQPPSYLTSESIYTITEAGSSKEIPFQVLDTDQWPTTQFGLDTSQLEAFKFALTRELAVIQGPPGTGKTYLGVKIASILLKNLSLEGTPMLVICYTNHALDQFLEGILNVTNSIVRLGSQSKSKLLEPYNLNNVRMKIKCKYSYLYANKRAELEKVLKEMTNLQSDVEVCEKGIICYKYIMPYLKIKDELYELKYSKEDRVLNWLFSHLEDNGDEDEDWEKQFEDSIITDDNIKTCFSEQQALEELNSINNIIKIYKTDDHLKSQDIGDKFQSKIDKVKERLDCFKKHMALLQNNNTQNCKMEKVADLYSLTPEQRWRVYYSAVEALKDELLAKMDSLLEKYNTSSQQLDEVSTLIDGEVMRTARVVGVTTTTAARRHDLMRKLLSPIVLVEEAAEVLEAHIVASLTHRCQHLILIGDHKQLRPTAAHYKLAKDYNLEISLFERMIRNGIHARTLTTQRRMRRSFVDLLVPVIYERLDCHPSVYNYPNVRGMRDNLYFFTHDVFEDSEGLEDSWSHKNNFEAKWCVSLANYLRQMKYGPDEVTVLSTYTGQVTLIKQLSKKYSLLSDIKITAVDNYQGEESRIVILSLVRSNREGKIGFLNAANRICVALSRAKEGFYIFGNMNVLKSASHIWRHINNKLIEQNAIGKIITVSCYHHKKNTLGIKTIDDFDTCLSGSCLRICRK